MTECIVLAGGFGTRLQSVVSDVPKCMAEVAQKPFLQYLFAYLEKQGIGHVILSLGYKSEIVIDWIDANVFPFEMSYVVELEPLGTGGAISYAMTKAKTESVFVINGDTFFSVDLSDFYSFHTNNNADISLALKHMTNFDRYGSVELGAHNTIIKFNEKQFCESGMINGGVYLIRRSFMQKMALPQKFSFEKDILENRDLNINMLGYISDSYFIDIGIPEDFVKANIDFAKWKG